MCHGHHLETGQMYCIYFWSFTGSLDSSRGNGPKLWHWSLLCKEVVWKHIAAWSKWKWRVWMVFGPPCGGVFYIFSFLSTDVPWGQRPAWNAVASACGRLQQWDRVLNQFLGIAGCGGRRRLRDWLWREFLQDLTVYLGIILHYRWVFILVFFVLEVSVVSVVSISKSISTNHRSSNTWGKPLLRMNFFQTPQAEAYGHSPRVLKVFFVFFWRTRTAKLAVILIKHIWKGGFKYIFFFWFSPLLWKIIWNNPILTSIFQNFQYGWMGKNPEPR